jgi:hypothetical protein
MISHLNVPCHCEESDNVRRRGNLRVSDAYRLIVIATLQREIASLRSQ